MLKQIKPHAYIICTEARLKENRTIVTDDSNIEGLYCTYLKEYLKPIREMDMKRGRYISRHNSFWRNDYKFIIANSEPLNLNLDYLLEHLDQMSSNVHIIPNYDKKLTFKFHVNANSDIQFDIEDMVNRYNIHLSKLTQFINNAKYNELIKDGIEFEVSCFSIKITEINRYKYLQNKLKEMHDESVML